MANAQLVDYVKKAKAKGISKAQIENALKGRGWPENEIKAAFDEASSDSGNIIPPKPKERLGVVSTLIMLFTRPTRFFEHVENEEGYLKPLLYFVITAIAVSLISTLLSIMGSFGAIAMIVSLVMYVILIPLLFAVPFIVAGITHLGVLMFGGRKGFFNTFKVVTYASIIGIFYSIAITIVGLVNNMFAPKVFSPEILSGGMPLETASFMPMIALGITILIGVISFIHVLYAEVNGISMYHQISKLKAFFGVLIVPFIIFVIVGGLFVPLFMAYYGVLSPNEFLPESCMGPSGFDCVDKVVVNPNGELGFVVKNNFGYDITIDQLITTSGECDASMISSVNGLTEFPVAIGNNQQATIQINCGKLPKGRFKESIALSYTNTATRIPHSATIDIRSSVK